MDLENLPIEPEDVYPVLGQQVMTIVAMRKELARLMEENEILRITTATGKPEAEE